jgi:hypothetical protein
MDLPMAGQQPTQQPVQQAPLPAQQPQAQPVQQGQQPQGQPAKNGKGPFPANRGEALQFANDLLQIIYSEKIFPNILQQLDDVNSVDVGKGVGLIAGHLIGNRVADVRGQTGRQIERRLLIDKSGDGAVFAVIGELAEIAERNQLFQMNDAQKKQALAVTLKVLDDMGGGNGQQRG